MRHSICLISYNRPDMLKLALEKVERSVNREDFDLFIYQDGPEKIIDLEGYNVVEYHTHPKRVGLSVNILECLRDQFENRGYDLVTIIEDDVLVSDDFAEWTRRCADFEKEEIFTISGFGNTRPGPDDEAFPEYVYLTDWYFTGGVTFRKVDYDLIAPHICKEFFNHSGSYIHSALGELCKEKNPDFYNFVFIAHGQVRWPLQAGLINCIRVAHGRKQITPELSRCQNIGYYGFNQGNKSPDGSDVRNSENWKRGLYFNPTWLPSIPVCDPIITEQSISELRSTKPWEVNK